MVGRVMAPKDVCSSPQDFKYLTLYGKSDAGDVIKSRTLRWEIILD